MQFLQIRRRAEFNRDEGDERDREIPGMPLCHCEERWGSWSDAAIPVSINATSTFSRRDAGNAEKTFKLGRTEVGVTGIIRNPVVFL